jgi:glucokinase
LHNWATSQRISRPILLSSPPVLALDLGGTRIRAAVVQSDGTRLARTATDTPVDDGPDAVVAECRRTLERARDAAPADIASSLVGIGISSPGPVDPRSGAIVEPPNLGPKFRDIPITRDMSDALGLPAFLDRDTNVAALGERAFGAAKGFDDFIYLTVSTGVGGAIVTGGRLLHGPDGLAGELGHVPVTLEGPLCGCGGPGHVESYASGAGLSKLARAVVEAGESPFLAERAREHGDPHKLSALDVAEGRDAGDPACMQLMDRARRAVAVACVGYINAFNPHRIVIGGSIAEAEGERLLGQVRDAIANEAFKAVSKHVSVAAAGLGGDVSLAGAHPLVMSRLDEVEPRSSSPSRPAEPVGASPRR